MKKISIWIVVQVLILCFICVSHAELTAWGYCMLDGHTGRVLYEQNADISHEIASITKIMTAICAIENAELSDTVTVSAHASGTEGSSCWLEEGEQLSMEDMLYGLMLASGNDAAVAIAEHVSGNEAAFVALMNDTAKRLGAHNTSFKNPHGLDEEGHYSSCHDMAIITKHALSFPVFRTIVATQRKTIPWQNKAWDRTLENHNKFLSMYPDVIGVKTGYTDKAGRTLVTAVERGAVLLILVTIAAPDDWNDHKKLYDLAFSEYSMQTIMQTEPLKSDIPVLYGNEELCRYKISEPFCALIKNGEDASGFSFQASLPDQIKAPVKKGDILGRMDIFCEGEWVDSCDIIAEQSIDKSTIFERISDRMASIFRHIFLFFIS